MTTIDPTKLSDWLPILELPEVGERICEAAGARLEKDSEGVAVTELWFPGYGGLAKSSVLFGWQISALAFGTLAVLAEGNGEGWLCCCDEIDEWSYEWSVMDYEGHQRGYGRSLPAAVLAAAHRVWCE